MKPYQYFVGLWLLVLLLSPCYAQDDFVLIVNRSSSIDYLSLAEASNIFLGKKTYWSDGTEIQIFIQENTPVNQQFTNEVLNKSPHQYFTYWRKALFIGKGNPPITADDDVEMKMLVASHSNGIGYISPKSLDDTVKALKIK